jgi:hypothetical protein
MPNDSNSLYGYPFGTGMLDFSGSMESGTDLIGALDEQCMYWSSRCLDDTLLNLGNTSIHRYIWDHGIISRAWIYLGHEMEIPLLLIASRGVSRYYWIFFRKYFQTPDEKFLIMNNNTNTHTTNLDTGATIAEFAWTGDGARITTSPKGVYGPLINTFWVQYTGFNRYRYTLSKKDVLVGTQLKSM